MLQHSNVTFKVQSRKPLESSHQKLLLRGAIHEKVLLLSAASLRPLRDLDVVEVCSIRWQSLSSRAQGGKILFLASPHLLSIGDMQSAGMCAQIRALANLSRVPNPRLPDPHPIPTSAQAAT